MLHKCVAKARFSMEWLQMKRRMPYNGTVKALIQKHCLKETITVLYLADKCTSVYTTVYFALHPHVKLRHFSNISQIAKLF